MIAIFMELDQVPGTKDQEATETVIFRESGLALGTKDQAPVPQEAIIMDWIVIHQAALVDGEIKDLLVPVESTTSSQLDLTKAMIDSHPTDQEVQQATE